jgi:hypothetical protein
MRKPAHIAMRRNRQTRSTLRECTDAHLSEQRTRRDTEHQQERRAAYS